MQDPISNEDGGATENRRAWLGAPTEQQILAASIERDFQSLLDSLKLYQAMADPKAVPQIEKVQEEIKRGIGLILRLRNMVNSQI